MKRTIALVLLLALTAMAGEVAGKWSGSFRADGADHDVPQLFILKQEGNKLTGSGRPDQSEQYPIENGKVDGDRVRFELTTGECTKMVGALELKSPNDRRTARVSLSKAQ